MLFFVVYVSEICYSCYGYLIKKREWYYINLYNINIKVKCNIYNVYGFFYNKKGWYGNI